MNYVDAICRKGAILEQKCSFYSLEKYFQNMSIKNSKMEVKQLRQYPFFSNIHNDNNYYNLCSSFCGCIMVPALSNLKFLSSAAAGPWP